ncbi:MAG: TonB-dependent receptor [Tannerellaceae bacterium]|nr:TonB-dependent receptor [Tannerellaceae bacterium]
MRKSTLLLLLVTLLPSMIWAQNKITVKGVVYDDLNMTVPGASVVEKGTQNGIVTDMDGNFVLSVSPGATLVVSFLGYASQDVPATDRQLMVITLREDNQLLDEVVITGYGGSQKRATLTTAISKMDDKVLQNAAFSNVGQALQGSVTGLRVVNTSGQPGENPDIVLRGGATISGNNNGALIIVDGVIRENMQGISSDDIESMQVLKDAASTAIYGARANGGVILIETKKGSAGASSVNYKFKMGVNKIRKGYDFLNAEDYIYYNRMGYKRYNPDGGVDTQMGYGIGNNLFDIRYLNEDTRHLLSQGWQSMADPYYDGETILFRDYGGQLDDAVFNSSAITQDHHLSFAGGNDKGTFAASLGYYKEDGLVNGTGLERFTGSFNGSYKVLPFLTVKAGTTYSWQKTPALWIGSYEMFYRVRSQRPTWNPWTEEGEPASGFGTGDGNPLYYKDILTRQNGVRRTTYNGGFSLDIIPKKLVLNGNASLYHYDEQKEEFDKAYQRQDQNTPVSTRQAKAYYRKRNQQQVNTTLNYTDTFAGKHNVDVMVGGEYYNWHEFVFEATTEGSPTDDIPTLNAGSTRTATSSSKTGYRILSAFGRANYNYNMKYLLSFTARYDGISRLVDNRWGFFPGVSAGWNVMEEDFWKGSAVSNYVSNLKPRISYGVNGNVSAIGNYEAYGVYAQTKDYGGNTGFYNGFVDSADNKLKGLVKSGLRWEQSQTFEAGLDISFFNNRLSFIMDYYSRRTKDLLTGLNLPAYTGFDAVTTNLGTLKNYGFEMEIKANILNLKNGFTWDMSANMTTVANKIISLPYNGNENNRQGGVQVWDPKTNQLVWLGATEEGGKLGVLYGYKQVRIFRDWDDVRENANMFIDEVASLYGPGRADEYAGQPGWRPIEPGDVFWQDTNGDGVINGYDRVEIGNIFPKVTGGFTTTFGYKGVSLYARFDYALGHTIYNDLAARSLGQYQGSFNVIDMVKNTWTETNRDTDLPAFYYADQLSKKNITRSNNANTVANDNSSRFYEKGDYLALRELTISYELPKNWIRPAYIQQASVYVTGQNLCYITGYTGVSPEPAVSTTYGRGIDNGRYPTPRTFLFGLSVTF